MQYRDIDRKIGDLAIIAAPSDQMISHMKASKYHVCPAQQHTRNS